MNDQAIEQEIKAVGADVAPRITPADIKANIASEHYFTALHGVEGAMAKLELHQHHADTDTLTQKAPPPAFDALACVTICTMILRNGHKIVGVNEGPVSRQNFDPAMGRKLARQKAIDQIWPLMGYELKCRLAREAAYRDE